MKNSIIEEINFLIHADLILPRAACLLEIYSKTCQNRALTRRMTLTF